MSAPLIWIIAPGLVVILLLLLRRREKLVIGIGIGFSLALVLIAWLDPIGDVFKLGPITLTISDSLSVLGRRFVLESNEAPVLVLIYLGVAFWFGGAGVARAGSLFVPVGLMIASLVTAALAVEPFLYSALLIEMAAIVAITIFSVPGKPINKGSLRFLIIQTMSMPFILLTGWLLTGVEASPADSAITVQAVFSMALGFALLLWIFPFHTWMPMTIEVANQYVVSFVFFMLPLIITFFGLGFLDRFAWLRTQTGVYTALQMSGLFMVLAGGFGAAYQKHLGRMLAFGMMVEIGITLLTIGIPGPEPGSYPLIGVFFASLLPRGLGLGVWALGLIVISRADQRTDSNLQSLDLNHLRGIGMHLPLACSALILAQLSIAGFPLLAGFPVRLPVWQGLANHSIVLALSALLGSAGLLIASLRTLVVFVGDSDEMKWVSKESWAQRILLMVGVIGLFLIGIFPQIILPQLASMARVFINLNP